MIAETWGSILAVFYVVFALSIARSLRSLVKCFQDSKRTFVSPRGHVILSVYLYVLFCAQH